MVLGYQAHSQFKLRLAMQLFQLHHYTSLKGHKIFSFVTAEAHLDYTSERCERIFQVLGVEKI